MGAELGFGQCRGREERHCVRGRAWSALLVQLAEVAVCHIFYIVARAGNRTDISFRQKLLICLLHGVETDVQLVCEETDRF